MLKQKEWVKSRLRHRRPDGIRSAESRKQGAFLRGLGGEGPDSANLDRVQIVKGWSINGQSFEKIYDVVWAGARKPDPATGKVPAIGSTVDLTKGTYTNTIGAVELKTVWSDPDFDPALDAFYYVRVLEIPTPRWSTIQAVKLGRVPPSGTGFTAIIQERAWSSPIWYTPSAEARKASQARADRRRPEQAGRAGARRCAAQGTARRQDGESAQLGDRPALRDPPRRCGPALDHLGRRQGRRTCAKWAR
jgi:hypothetical protein